MENKGRRFHKVGEFWTHFPDDLEDMIMALSEYGYSVCETLDGDMIIMKPDEYDEFPKEFEDNEDDDNWDGDGYKPTSYDQ